MGHTHRRDDSLSLHEDLQSIQHKQCAGVWRATMAGKKKKIAAVQNMGLHPKWAPNIIVVLLLFAFLLL
jgi:hypothetical protein